MYIMRLRGHPPPHPPFPSTPFCAPLPSCCYAFFGLLKGLPRPGNYSEAKGERGRVYLAPAVLDWHSLHWKCVRRSKPRDPRWQCTYHLLIEEAKLKLENYNGCLVPDQLAESLVMVSNLTPPPQLFLFLFTEGLFNFCVFCSYSLLTFLRFWLKHQSLYILKSHCFISFFSCKMLQYVHSPRTVHG